jgi:DNA processing protein
VSACPECLRRGRLLGALSGRLEYRGRAPDRLAALLALDDERLIRALGGKDAEELLIEHAQLDPAAMSTPEGVERICRHERRYPRELREGAGMPSLLHVAGGIERLRALLAEPTVAIVGTRAASDYGMEVAHGLARGLAASGVTVMSGLADGIAAAAHAGALEIGGPTVTVTAGGVDVCHPARRGALQRRIQASGCLLSEMPCGERPRGWCHTARARIVVALAGMVIVVEARDSTGELVHAQLARSTGRLLAAVPGRVGSARSEGSHVLLREGALLVRGPGDVLDALCELRPRASGPPPPQARQPAVRKRPLEARLQAILDHVGAGRDTLSKLLAAGCAEQKTLVALAELELEERLIRGDGGRYLPRL